jgi:hypothetical protein
MGLLILQTWSLWRRSEISTGGPDKNGTSRKAKARKAGNRFQREEGLRFDDTPVSFNWPTPITSKLLWLGVQV